MEGKGLRMGLDIGSTTAKIVILNPDGSMLHSDYRRHNAAIGETLSTMVRDSLDKLGNRPVSIAVTGSAGLGITERHSLPFVQEVIASAETVRVLYPHVRTLIDVGGEDSKMIFFDERMRVDIRMNGNCAGGTGAFIDQMASLLNVGLDELDELSMKAQERHKIASRCGVFAKTDVQNLISRKVPPSEIAASIFHAMALQTVSTLSRGCDPRPKVLFCGGPFTFLPTLKSSFMEVLGISRDDIVDAVDGQFIPAIGTALYGHIARMETDLSSLSILMESAHESSHLSSNRLDPLFRDDEERIEWLKRRTTPVGTERTLSSANGGRCYLGIDSGSTTTKIVLIDDQERIVFSHYSGNLGDPVKAARKGLLELRAKAEAEGIDLQILGCASTGYGEELMKAAFDMDSGIVETMAHFRAAREFQSEVSFVLDIGGQDMKALFIRDGMINDVELNEACSSGCGSFLETFSRNLGLNVQSFGEEACTARSPYDLGTRCTVFMNSKVKQALREGASIGDISAGLAVSVVKNCLYKVLKIKDVEVLGEKIVVQGGTFRNPAVHRALELILGKEVICPDIPELMGAYGAALIAKESSAGSSSFIGLKGLEDASAFKRETIHCNGCNNTCAVTKMTFPNGKVFFSGNRCERIFTNRGRVKRVGRNLADEKMDILFSRPLEPKGEARGTIGIPRVLNLFDNFPFWSTILIECGFKVVLSPHSNNSIMESGSRNIMSENICFPAKLATGHVIELSKMGVDRILYPIVVFETSGSKGSLETFNCPIVTGYPDVIASTLDMLERDGIHLDRPTISFKDRSLLKKGTWNYLKGLGVPKKVFGSAFERAVAEQDRFRKEVLDRSADIVKESRDRGSLVVLLLGRPYHIDHLINHKITEMITQFGADVITEDSVPEAQEGIDSVQVLTQWEYPNRIYNAVKWASHQDNVEVIQLNSFGCGPDALVYDEARSILSAAGKGHTLIRIDEVSSPGSIKLRLRSMFESMEERGSRGGLLDKKRITTPPYTDTDTHRKLLVPYFSRFFSPILETALRSIGFDIETLPEPDRSSIEIGLKYCNNDICYPAIVTIGDLLKAVKTGKYDTDRIALGITQTGGQCRASSYVSLLKKAILTAGYKNIPVVTVSLSSKKLNEQPGLKIDWMKMLSRLLHGTVYADGLMEMYYSTAPREVRKGTSNELVDRYIREAQALFMDGRHSELPELLEKAVQDFNAVPVKVDPVPVIGIVGEIYVKYNSFGNFRVVDHLIENGIEPVVPPIFEFFSQELLNHRVHAESFTKDRTAKYYLSYPAEWYVRYFLRQYDRANRQYVRHRPRHAIGDLADDAKGIVSLVSQFGEGWLIPAEISAFAKDGIVNVLCLQPFGCISYHIIGKGIENALKRAHPELNILYLDMDAGSSEVNIYNRLNFMMRSSREDLERKANVMMGSHLVG